MRLKVDRTPRSKRDVFDIWDYIASDSPRAAEKQLRRIDNVIATLAERPEAGRINSDLGAEIRSFPVDRYLVFYRPTQTTLTVLRILHAARDIKPPMLSE